MAEKTLSYLYIYDRDDSSLSDLFIAHPFLPLILILSFTTVLGYNTLYLLSLISAISLYILHSLLLVLAPDIVSNQLSWQLN